MTAVLGWRVEGRLWLAADSAIAGGEGEIHNSGDFKIRDTGPMIIAGAGTMSAIVNAIQANWSAYLPDWANKPYKALQGACSRALKGLNLEDTTLVMGYCGNWYTYTTVDGLLPSNGDMISTGSGGDLALGALSALEHVDHDFHFYKHGSRVKELMRVAMKQAIEHNAFCKPPIYVVSIPTVLGV